MSERLFARIVIGLSVLLIVAEIALIVLYGVRIELIILPLVAFLGALGILAGLVFLKGTRVEIESVSTRRARAKKDEKVRRLLEGYEVDEEFLPGGRKKNKQPGHKKQPVAPETREAIARPVAQEPYRNPFEEIDPKIRSLAEGFGGFEQMIQKIEAMDAIAYKRLQYSLGIEGVDKERLLRPVKKALAKAAGGDAGLRQDLDHEEMQGYMEQTMNGKQPEGKGDDNPTYYLDVNLDDLGGRMAPPPGEFSHNPRDVIDHFKKSLKKK